MKRYNVSWGDGNAPDSDKGCSLIIAQIALLAALALGVAWSGRRA